MSWFNPFNFDSVSSIGDTFRTAHIRSGHFSPIPFYVSLRTHSFTRHRKSSLILGKYLHFESLHFDLKSVLWRFLFDFHQWHSEAAFLALTFSESVSFRRKNKRFLVKFVWIKIWNRQKRTFSWKLNSQKSCKFQNGLSTNQTQLLCPVPSNRQRNRLQFALVE